MLDDLGSLNKTGALDTNPDVSVHIGRNTGGYGSFDGYMDDVRVYDRALTLDEIQELASQTNPS